MKDSTDIWINEGKGGYLVNDFNSNIWVKKIKLALKINNITLKSNSKKLTKLHPQNLLILNILRKLKNLMKKLSM